MWVVCVYEVGGGGAWGGGVPLRLGDHGDRGVKSPP